ncbi:MAG: hypothetical protein ACTSRZ_19860, partial [Promethearchaeota archaeon]
YRPSLLFDLFKLMLGHTNRAPVLGILSTLQGSNAIRGISGMIIVFLTIYPDVIPYLAFYVQDTFIYADYLELTWIFLGIILFMVFRKKLKNPLYLLGCISPIIVYILRIEFHFEFLNSMLVTFNLIMLLLFIFLFYYEVTKTEELARDEVFVPILFSIFMFLTVYWVNYPWFFLWMAPLLLIYAFNIREGRYLLVFVFLNSFVLSLYWFSEVILLPVVFILVLIILICEIFLFWKLLEYREFFDGGRGNIFEKVESYLPETLHLNMGEFYEDVKPYNWALFIVLLINIINMMLITIQILILTPILQELNILNNYFISFFFQNAFI